MNISFENKVALVTGAASGLGLATAKAFAESGASVVLADWNEEAAQSAAKELTNKGHKTLAVRCDVSDDAQVEAMVKQTVCHFRTARCGIQQCRRSKCSRRNCRYYAGRLRPGDGDQPPRSVELHEVRAATDAQTRKWNHRQLLFARGTRRRLPSVASTTPPSTESLGSPRALLSNTPHAAFASMLYVRDSFGRRWPTRWSRRAKVKPSRAMEKEHPDGTGWPPRGDCRCRFVAFE